jgi:hypothetical protein
MLSFNQFISESSPPAGIHPEVWRAHEKHMVAIKRHNEGGLGIHKAAVTRTFQTFQKKLKKHEPDESKHLKMMQDMIAYSDKNGDL